MKRNQARIFLAALIFLLAACGGVPEKNVAQLKQAAVQAIPHSKHGLTFTIQSQTNSELTALIQNGRNQAFTYGRPFEIQQKQNGIWYVIPFKENHAAFEDIALLARPRFQTIDTIDLTRLSQPLEPGHYRVVKVFQKYSLNEQRKSVYGEKFQLAALFTVEAP